MRWLRSRSVTLRGAFVSVLLSGILVGCAGDQTPIPTDSTPVPLSTPQSIRVMAGMVGDWIETETEWMKALIDDRIEVDEFEELSWSAYESLDLMRTDITERVDVLPDDAHTALRPLTGHLAKRAEAFGTMSLLYFEGSEEGWQASVRTYLEIIDPDHVRTVADDVRAAVTVANLAADTDAAVEALLVTLEQSDSGS
jgi:hypothetical protein